MSRDHIRSARFAAEEIATIERAAKTVGVNVSAYLRHCALVASLPRLEDALRPYQPQTWSCATGVNANWTEVG